MNSTPHLEALDNKVLAVKRNCYLVQYLINEKASDLMLEGSKTEYMDADTKSWLNFLADLNKCMEQANEVKAYLASSNQVHFNQTDIDISTLDRPFFIRKYALVEKLLDDLKTSTEEVSRNLSFQERSPFSIWERELTTIIKDYSRLIKTMKRHEKLR